MTIRIPTTPRPVVPPTIPTPVPVPTPTKAQLRLAEKQLKLAGFNPGKLDGVATPAFTAALKGFQAAWGIAPTGQLDAVSLKRLQHTAGRIHAHAKKKDGFVSVGQKSGGIETLEKRLKKLGYDVGKVDGVYDRQLAKASKAFRADQSELKNNISGFGNAAQKVLKKELAAISHAPERRRLAPTAAQTRLDRATAALVSRGPVAEGATGGAVANIQKHLKAAGFDPQHVGGKFDERTEAMVKQFQVKSKLPVTGTVDGRTWKALQKSFILSKKPAAPAQALNERSGAVKASEKLLKKLGFNPGKIDGLFDKNTLRAVRAYEKKRHLEVDGKIGTNQLEKMKKDFKAQNNWRTKVIENARRHLGFHERGENGNPFSTFFGRPPEAWCADFVSYCYTKAGKKLNEPWTPALLAKLHANGTYTRNNPKPGDIIMFDWQPGSGPTAQHTGIVEKVFRRNGRLMVQTIEGNSGDAVRRNTYAVGDSRIAGFGNMH
ncbi:MAG: peptidoglycan-binding protein [Archangium sp.]|nr:peptidoglycan-binding protein [Archangium sp.]